MKFKIRDVEYEVPRDRYILLLKTAFKALEKKKVTNGELVALFGKEKIMWSLKFDRWEWVE